MATITNLTAFVCWLLLSNNTTQRKDKDTPSFAPEILKVQSKLLREKTGYCDNKAKILANNPGKWAVGKNGSWEREVHKLSSKHVGARSSWPSNLLFEVVRNTTAWRSKICLLDWIKKTRSNLNLSKTRPKHASLDYPHSPEALATGW